MIDYYAILGVSRNSTQTEIRDAYLRLARETHPDKVVGAEARKKAEDVFKNVTAAYDTLSKERSRRDYTARLPPEQKVKVKTEPEAKPKAAPPVVQGPPLPPREPKPEPVPAPIPAAVAGPTSSGGKIRSGPVNFETLNQGIEAYQKKDYHAAVQLLNMAVTQDERNARAHAMLGLSLAKNPNWVRDALREMETASKLEPKNVSYLVELALMLHAQGLKLRAKRTLESAIAIAPDHPDVARGLAEIPLGPPEPETPTRGTGETSRGLFDRLRKR